MKSYGEIFLLKTFQRWTLMTLFLAVISLDSALKKDENCYLKVFLKECKYIEKIVIIHIIDDLESSSDDSDEE